MLRIEPVKEDNRHSFLRYIKAHGSEHDESYLPGAGFRPSPQQPSYLALHDGDIVGVVSLMRTPRYLRAGRGRFAVFHALETHSQAYPLLFRAILPHLGGLQSVYLFLPERRKTAAEAILHLGFAVERYSYVMKLDPPDPAGMVVPAGLTLRTLRPGEEDLSRLYADAINASFGELAGHIPMRPDTFLEWMKEETYLEDGYALLLQGSRAVGTVGVTRDVDDGNAGEVSALSVAKDMRHRGLGRLLLRHAVCFACQHGLRPIFLSLNAENGLALQLYRSEGFVVTDTMVCYSRDCSLAAP